MSRFCRRELAGHGRARCADAVSLLIAPLSQPASPAGKAASGAELSRNPARFSRHLVPSAGAGRGLRARKVTGDRGVSTCFV